MLKGFWPHGPADQTTPKATPNSGTGIESNPFDAHAASYTAKLQAEAAARSAQNATAQQQQQQQTAAGGSSQDAASSGSTNAAPSSTSPEPLKASAAGQRIPLHPGEITPGLRTPGGVASQANIPTTSLSTTVPDFTMHMPPKKNKDASKAAAPGTAVGSSASNAAGAADAPSTSSTSTTAPAHHNGPTRNTAAPRGTLTVKVISGRNLKASSPSSRPYAVVSFDKNEFIGREPMDEDEIREGEAAERAAAAAGGAASGSAAQGKGKDGSLPNGAFGDGASSSSSSGSSSSRGRAGTVTPDTSGSSSGSKGEAASETGPSNGSSSSAYNPVWKHEVKFDVTHENQAIFISVYDRHSEDEGFLGMRQIKPRLFHKMSSDQWYQLAGREELAGEAGASGSSNAFPASDRAPESRGEIRIQISYEKASQRKLTPADFEYMKLIGRGTFGRVFQVRKKDTKRIYAMKVLSKREIAIKKEVTHTMGERKILEKSLDCPFLVGLKFSFQSDTELYFVTDYKSGGELFWHLQREGRFTEERARFYIAELVLALEHLHKYDIVYRDLKPENILLDATGHVALCDFGLSKPDLGNGQLTNTFCGTTEYLAPEVLLDESGYSKLVDFWSLGVLLFEMCCGWSPFYAEDTQQMYRNICFGKIKFPRGAIGDDGKQFVKGLLNRNPKHRLGSHRDAVDLKEHAFFKDIDFEALYQKKIPPPFKPLVESEESVANFDPEFTMTDLREVAEIDGQTLATSAFNSNGLAIGKGASGGEDDEDGVLSSSIQHQFRGFSYSGRDDSGSFVGSRSRRGSSGFGLAGGAFGMSRMESPESSPSPERAMSVDREQTPAPSSSADMATS